MRKTVLAALAAFTLIVVPAEASLSGAQAAATWAVNKECARFTGCRSATATYQYRIGQDCYVFLGRFHTTYYGWKTVTITAGTTC